MTGTRRKGGLAAILDMLERELIDAPDGEIAGVLQELGLRPEIAGSVALFELLGWHRPEDYAVRRGEPVEVTSLWPVLSRPSPSGRGSRGAGKLTDMDSASGFGDKPGDDGER